MRYNSKIAVLILLSLVTIASVFLTNISKNGKKHLLKYNIGRYNSVKNVSDYNVWCIFTKADERSVQTAKFGHMLSTMLVLSSIPVSLHLIVDEPSKKIAQETVEKTLNFTGKNLQVKFYDIVEVVSGLEDLVSVMKPHFSPKAGTYYSDSLFYVSLGLHKVAHKDMQRAILLDVDLQFENDIALLFNEFNSFSVSNLYGLAPELAPVYFHLLSTFRTHNAHRNLNVGLPCCARLPLNSLAQIRRTVHSNISSQAISVKSEIVSQVDGDRNVEPTAMPGRPGLNSGVVLLRLDRIRSSLLFQTVTTYDFVSSLADKYFFKGHLGDQDFYSLLSWELPSLIYTLDCSWNRQLCTWWKDHGYENVHSAFSYCPNKTKLFHANCNSRFPSSEKNT